MIVFAAGSFLLLQDMVDSVTLAVIDQEYTGYDALIRDRLLQFMRAAGLRVYPDMFAFSHVGKKSSARDLATRVHGDELTPDHQVTLGELLAVLQ